MLPYQAVAMEYGYQRQTSASHGGGHLAPMGSLAMGPVGGGPFQAHSWLMPAQDLCTVPYNKISNHQHQPGSVLHQQPQTIEPGLVEKIPKQFSLKL